MTDNVDIVNRALQTIGTRTTVTAAEMTAGSSNEAIQANIILTKVRDQLLRMAPWDCGFNYSTLVYITSTPGTPENVSPGTALWQKGQPAPPWAYEYQYPVDCLRACWIIPQSQAGFSSGVPITNAVTGGSASFWQWPPTKYKVAVDQFIPVTGATLVSGGTGHATGDRIQLAYGPAGSVPVGAPVVMEVLTVTGAGTISTFQIVNQIQGSATPMGGSYFTRQTNPVSQGTSTGSGTGARFNLTFGTKGDQRVILTNQQHAAMAYVKQITDPNVMDPLFIDAWTQILGAYLVNALTGDKALAKMLIDKANDAITEARKTDGNEGITVNDVLPDWIRGRGISFAESYSPNSDFDWGGLWQTF